MSSSASSGAMKKIFAMVQPALRDLGYRKSGGTFNRTVEPDSLVHVVSFRRGGYIQTVPGERRVAPTPYGGFTVDLGVWLPGVEAALMGREEGEEGIAPRKVISPAHCQLRPGLGQLLPIPCDYWWPVSDDGQAGEVAEWALTEFGLPWLGQFVTWDQVLRIFEDGPAGAFGSFGGPAPRLVAMGMRLARGDHDQAERDFTEQLKYLAAEAVPEWQPDSYNADHIDSLRRLAVAHHFDVDVRAYAAEAHRRERDRRAQH